MRLSRRFRGALATAVVVAAGCGGAERDAAWPAGAAGPRAEIVVDIAGARDGRVPVSLRLDGVAGTGVAFRSTASKGEYTIHDPAFTDDAGRAIEHHVEGSRYRLEPFEGDAVVARWDAEPGGAGRHGLQGALTEDWAMFDGRLFLVPASLTAARIRFVLPRGWTVASPFRRDGDWYYLDMFQPTDTGELLASSCAGVGRFDHQSRQVGGMEVRVAAPAAWEASHKASLFESTFRVVAYFHDTLGFDLGAPYSVVWSSDAGGQRVHGGSHVNGTCLDYGESTVRRFQLLAHRVAHALDKYPPSGMRVATPENAWFREGWPTYMEVMATRAAGVVLDRSHFNSIYSNYTLTLKSLPERDIPLAQESSAPRDAVEYVHYTKAPLFTEMLAFRVSLSGRTLEEFMRAMWAEHGFRRGSFDLQRELEAFVGTSLDDFWEANIRRRGIGIPVWREFLTDGMRARLGRSPAARVGDEPLSGDYLHHLAWSGDFGSFEEIRAFLVAEQLRRRELDARGVVLYPEELRRHLSVLPAAERYAIARHEAAHPLVAARQALTAADVRLEPERDDPDGRDFAALLEAEARYAAALPGSGLAGLVLRTRRGTAEGTPRLAFAPDALVELAPLWRRPPRRIEVELLVDGQPVKSWTLDPAQGRKAVAFIPPQERPDAPGPLTFRVRSDGGAPLLRAFWQRDSRRRDEDRFEVANPEDPRAWHTRGLVLAATGDHAGALTAFHHATTLAPDDPRGWFEQGESLAALGRHAEAIESYDRALALEPGFLAAAGQRALALAGSGQRAEALAAAERLLERHADAPSSVLWKGRVLERTGELARAVESFREYTERQPKRPEGWQALGQALAGLGRHGEALRAFDRALGLDPRAEAAKRGREEALRALEGGS